MKKLLLYTLGAVTLLSGCSREQDLEPKDTPQVSTSMSSAILPGNGLPGIAYVKVPRELQSQMTLSPTGEFARHSLPSKMSVTLNSIKTEKIEPLFTMDPRFEKRMKAEELDCWYIVHFDEQQDLGQVLTRLANSEQFNFVEPVYEQSVFKYKRVDEDPLLSQMSAARLSEEYPFRDPDLPKQWHYKNYGQSVNNVRSAVAGADINLFEAWKTEVGKRNIVVSVVDGGVDYAHEDLRENMWRNPGEIEGDGIDNDGNGMIDDVYGYNFVLDDDSISADDHGTHVAGTVSARNNNDIGVCGVAGGDGTDGSGVRIMTCPIFEGNKNGNSPNAIVYSANNGAIISQNSWGYRYPGGPTSIPNSIKVAIDYFIKYAGCDSNGNQKADSPMKGGVVVFAAGNDDLHVESYPAAYEPTVAVAAMAPNWKKAWYTTRGPWVDIMAPGGDTSYGKSAGVYSTIPGGYTNFQGTSMACPHVSGIAALIVSKYGKPGFTNTELVKRLLGGLRPENIDAHNPDFAGNLGIGYIDAAEGLVDRAAGTNLKPEDVTTITADVKYTSLELKWEAVQDADDKMPVRYVVYFSETPITATNYRPLKPILMNAYGYKPGTVLKKAFDDLKENTNYYAGIIAVDRWGAESTIRPATIKTLKNTAPEIAGLPTTKPRVTAGETSKFVVSISDIDGHKMTYKMSGETRGVAVSRVKDKLHFTIRAIAPVGEHKAILTVTDELGASTKVEIPFEVYVYEAPSIIDPIKPMLAGVDQGTRTIDLNKHFKYQEGAKVTFNATSSNSGVASVKIDGTTLIINAHKAGTTKVSTSISDGVNTPMQLSFDVRVVANSKDLVYMVYPIPTREVLNVVVNPEVTSANFVVRTEAGEKVLERKINSFIEGMPTQFNVKRLAPGTYLLVVETNKGTYKKTFVKL